MDKMEQQIRKHFAGAEKENKDRSLPNSKGHVKFNEDGPSAFGPGAGGWKAGGGALKLDEEEEEDEEWDDTVPSKPAVTTYGAPGSTTTAQSSNRRFGTFGSGPAPPGGVAGPYDSGGGDELTRRLEALQHEVNESAQRVASLKLQPNLLDALKKPNGASPPGGVPPAARGMPSALGGGRGMGGMEDGPMMGATRPYAPGGAGMGGMGGMGVSGPPREQHPVFGGEDEDDEDEEEEGFRGMMAGGSRPGAGRGVPFTPGMGGAPSSHLSASEMYNGPPTSQDPEAAARRAAAIAKLKEMTLGGAMPTDPTAFPPPRISSPPKSPGEAPPPSNPSEALREARRRLAEERGEASPPGGVGAVRMRAAPKPKQEETESWFQEARRVQAMGKPEPPQSGGVKPYPVKTVQAPSKPKPEIESEEDDEDEDEEEEVIPQRPPPKKGVLKPTPQPDPAGSDAAAEAAAAAASGEGGGGATGLVLHEGLLRRKKEDHGRFEDPYKMLCVCRLQDSCLRVRITHNGEVVGLEEQFDLREWRLLPRNDKPDRFSLTRGVTAPDQTNVVTFKAEDKVEGAAWVDAIMEAQGELAGPKGGAAAARQKQQAVAARMREEEEAEEAGAAKPKAKPAMAGVGIVFKEVKRGGKQSLVVKALAPGAPAISSGMIDVGDSLVSVDGKKINSTDTATKAILGEKGSTITMTFERENEEGEYDKYTVAMKRGQAATLPGK